MNGNYPKYRSNLKYSYGYNTSEAYELQPQQPRTKIIKKKRFRRLRPTKLVIRRVEDDKPKISIYSLVTMLMIFSCALAIAFSFAMNQNKSEDIAAANIVLKEMQEQNATLEAENSSKFKLTDIEKIATTKLGMSKPKAYQIIHINVPKQSYVMQYDSNNDNMDDKSITTKVLEFLVNLKG